VADAKGVQGVSQVDLLLGAYLPTQAQLGKNKGFVIINEANGEDKKITINGLPDAGKIIKNDLSGKEALAYRFQSYLKNEVESKNMENILTMQFMKDEMYRFAKQPVNNSSHYETAAEQALYYNRESNFVKNVQD
jgi:hypothetical protein